MKHFQHEVGMARNAKIAKLGQILHVKRLMAYAHVCCLFESVAQHEEYGSLADVPDALIEDWAEWSGARGRLTHALRAVGILESAGEIHGWRKRHEAYLNDRNKKRALRAAAATTRDHRGDDAGPPRGPRVCSRKPEPEDVIETRCSPVPVPVPGSGRVSGSIEPADSSGDEPRPGAEPPPTPRHARPEDAPPPTLEALRQPKHVRRWRAEIRGHLGAEHADLAVQVEAQITATALRNGRKPAAYVEGFLKQPRHVREIAVRCREEQLEREKGGRAGSDPGSGSECGGGPTPIASLLSQEMARLNEQPRPPDTS